MHACHQPSFSFLFLRNPFHVDALNVVMSQAHVSWEMRLVGREEGAVTERG